MAGDRCCDPSTTRSTDSDVLGKTLEEGWPRGPELSTPIEIVAQVVECAVQRAVFGGNEFAWRHFFQLVGASTATAIIRSVFPLDTAKALTQEKVKDLEKTDPIVSFIPITCATPIINAEPMGFYARRGLNVTVRHAVGWAVVRDWAITKEVDATHMLSPMPLSITLGQGPRLFPTSCLRWITSMGRRSRCTSNIRECRRHRI
jgi:nitrate/nitrite transport system substrate-binding protein